MENTLRRRNSFSSLNQAGTVFNDQSPISDMAFGNDMMQLHSSTNSHNPCQDYDLGDASSLQALQYYPWRVKTPSQLGLVQRNSQMPSADRDEIQSNQSFVINLDPLHHPKSQTSGHSSLLSIKLPVSLFMVFVPKTNPGFHRLSWNSLPNYPIIGIFQDHRPCICCQEKENQLCSLHSEGGDFLKLVPKLEFNYKEGDSDITQMIYFSLTVHGFRFYPTQLATLLKERLHLDFIRAIDESPFLASIVHYSVLVMQHPTSENVPIINFVLQSGQRANSVFKKYFKQSEQSGLIIDAVNQISLNFIESINQIFVDDKLTYRQFFLGTKLRKKDPRFNLPYYVRQHRGYGLNNVEVVILRLLKTVFSVRTGTPPITSLFAKNINQYQSREKLISFIQSLVFKINPVSVKVPAPITVDLKLCNCQVVFAHSLYVNNKELVQDNHYARQISIFQKEWLKGNYVQHLLVSRYNLPASLFSDSCVLGITKDFDQILSSIQQGHVTDQSIVSVTEFFERIRTQLFVEFVQGYQRFLLTLSKSQSKNYGSVEEIEKIQDKRMLLNQSEHRCLKQTFWQQVFPIYMYQAENMLSQKLSQYSLQYKDPKLPMNMLWRRLSQLVIEQKVLDDSKLFLFDTLYLSNNEEFTFMLLAMYISQNLFHTVDRAGCSFREHSNLYMYGDSGMGKTYLVEALGLLLNTSSISSSQVKNMFKGEQGTFGEVSYASASVLICTEVQIQNLFCSGAKEFLDISQTQRKVNIKYGEPVSIQQGVPFIFCSNDFPGKANELWEVRSPTFLNNEIPQLKQQHVSTVNRLCLVPFLKGKDHFLQTLNYTSDFQLLKKSSNVDHRMPYMISLILTAISLNQRITNYIRTETDVRALAKLFKAFEKTYLGMQMKYMNQKQLKFLEDSYFKFCCFEHKHSSMFRSTDYFRQEFASDADVFCQHRTFSAKIKTEFQTDYNTLYTSVVKWDTANERVYHQGYSKELFQTKLLALYQNSIQKHRRIISRDQLRISSNYLSIIQSMQSVVTRIPYAVIIDVDVEGVRKYNRDQIDEQNADYINLPIMEYFDDNFQNDVQSYHSDDFKSADSISDRSELQIQQYKRLLYTGMEHKL